VATMKYRRYHPNIRRIEAVCERRQCKWSRYRTKGNGWTDLDRESMAHAEKTGHQVMVTTYGTIRQRRVELADGCPTYTLFG